MAASLGGGEAGAGESEFAPLLHGELGDAEGEVAGAAGAGVGAAGELCVIVGGLGGAVGGLAGTVGAELAGAAIVGVEPAGLVEFASDG